MKTSETSRIKKKKKKLDLTKYFNIFSIQTS